MSDQQQGDATGGLIPYKNVPALVGYYLGIFSLIPFIGVLLCLPAFICGVIGLGKAKKEPLVKGKVHAWVGIILGGLVSLAYAGFLLLIVFSEASR